MTLPKEHSVDVFLFLIDNTLIFLRAVFMLTIVYCWQGPYVTSTPTSVPNYGNMYYVEDICASTTWCYDVIHLYWHITTQNVFYCVTVYEAYICTQAGRSFWEFDENAAALYFSIASKMDTQINIFKNKREASKIIKLTLAK